MKELKQDMIESFKLLGEINKELHDIKIRNIESTLMN
jgi:hypothetical protein